MVRPNSPPGLPRGPSGTLSQRNQVRSPNLSQPSGSLVSQAASLTRNLSSGEPRGQSLGSRDLASAQPSLPTQSRPTGKSGPLTVHVNAVPAGYSLGLISLCLCCVCTVLLLAFTRNMDESLAYTVVAT